MNARIGNLAGLPPLGQKKEKPSRGTAAGNRHMARVKALPCVICKRPGPSDAHHVFCGRYGSDKASDFETIPLCKSHHQHGPEAIHNAKESWEAKHGPDHSYLPLVAAWLNQNDDEILGDWF
ncbi:DUF968 domain-containing protein [Paracoccus sp. DMF]|uniref:DUF968 domain-containing protein n=1 Tax=Paracoccus sp. DMF TaxID=400837 RepID=UPI0021E3CC6A|nr:DUF968 domain-containing protein [Paracoccus sp. DMF]MCV2449400.1 DUF968 domain-containing protein [Paracoccus sp. DMF]